MEIDISSQLIGDDYVGHGESERHGVLYEGWDYCVCVDRFVESRKMQVKMRAQVVSNALTKHVCKGLETWA